MVVPALLSWMIERNAIVRDGVARLCLCVFVVVASLAREREIIERGLSARMTRNDVFGGESLSRETRLAFAVFATTARAFKYGLPLFGSNALFSHRQAPEFPGFPSARSTTFRASAPALPSIRRDALPTFQLAASVVAILRTRWASTSRLDV